MIARIWKGQTLESKADQYLAYMRDTGVKELRETPGNQGVYVLRRLEAGRAEFTFISLWESFDAIRRFAGEEVDQAVYYPEDRAYLLALDPKVMHYEVMMASERG